jgi:hypothetical protein
MNTSSLLGERAHPARRRVGVMGTPVDARRFEQNSSRGLCPSYGLVTQDPNDEPASVLLERIRTDVLGGERAAYDREIVATLSRQLVADHGRCFEEKNLRGMAQFSEVFFDEEIVVSLLRQFAQRLRLLTVPAWSVAFGQKILPTLSAEWSPQNGKQDDLGAAEIFRPGTAE